MERSERKSNFAGKCIIYFAVACKYFNSLLLARVTLALFRTGIRMVGIGPSAVETELVRKSMIDKEKYDPGSLIKDKDGNMIVLPWGRFMQPPEVEIMILQI